MAQKLYVWVAVGGIALASAGAWWFQNRPASEAQQAAMGTAAPGTSTPTGAASGSMPGVEVTKVQTLRLQDDAQSVGTLRSRQSVTLRPEVAGRIVQIAVSDGARVRKGQLLVQMDDTLQKAELSQAQAQLSIARANLKRNEELVAQSFVAQRVLDESRAALQVAEAQVSLAQARLARMRVVAPFDGTVGLININLGEYVKDGADLINLEDISQLTVDFRLPERYQGLVAAGQSVQVQLDALPGQNFQARIQAVDPLLDANGRSVAVRAVLPSTAGKDLRPGMFARVNTVFSVNDAALVVPEEAIVPQAGKQFVIKLRKEGEGDGAKLVTQRTEVRIGVRRAGQVEITDGVAAGDTVVVAGQQRLQQDGTAVRVVDMSRPVTGQPGAGNGGSPTGAPPAKPGDAPAGGKPPAAG